MTDTLSCAWRELTRRKRRTLANIFGYLLAVAIMVVLVGGLLNSREKTDRILSSTGTHFIAFLPACTPSCLPYYKEKSLTEDEGFVASGISTNLISINFIDEVNKLENVKEAAPFLLFQIKDAKDGHLYTIGGFNPQNKTAVKTTSCAPGDILEGRFLDSNDSGTVMVEDAYATPLKLKINDQISVAGMSFTVIGIINPGVRPAKANIYMTFKDAEKTINKQLQQNPIHNQANIMLVEGKNALVQDKAIQSIKELFPSLVFSSYNCYKPAAQVMGHNEQAVWSLILVIGIATIILSLKSQFSSVIERRREIGILKSIGWSNRNVVGQILVESILQAMIGGSLGCILAIALVLNPVRIFGSETTFNNVLLLRISTAGFILSFIGGVIAGSLPALLAARQQPGHALKSL
jgi:putative ABC transport system permease protein